MKHHRGVLIAALVLGAGLLAPAPAQAMSGYYATSCQGCHGASPTTCNGCHRHRGAPAGTLAKTTFEPNEPMAITVSAGQRSGWWRAAVLDQANHVLGTTSATGTGAVTVTVPAPATSGTYAWKVAWYGNAHTETPAAAGWVADAGNPGHGYLATALAAFTVAATPTPAPVAGLAPAALALGDVLTGQTASQRATVSNTGDAALVVSAAAACDSGNAASLTIAPTTGFTVAAGATATVTVTFAPSSSGAAAACWNLATNDPSHPTLQLTASGTGVAAPPAPTPVAGLAPATLALDTVTVGQSATRSATVSNTGNADLVVSGATPCDAGNAASLTLSPTAGFTVVAGATSTLVVAFAPTAAGPAAACWNLATNDAAHPSLQLRASGTGADQPPPPSCTGCHAVPPATGKHAAHVAEGCGVCHGAGYSSTTVVAGTHANGRVDLAASAGWIGATTSCANACHGARSWGTTPPPPTQACTTCHGTPPATGKHAKHAAKSCGACHGTGYSSTTVVAATHQDGKVTLGAAAGWSATARSCANTCHGTKSWGGGTTGACNSCHAMPPTSGRHALHRSEHVSCAACHGSGYSTSAANATTHRNGRVDLTAAVRWDATRRSCSGACHGRESWGGSGGTPSTGCTTCHRIPPASGEHAKHQSKRVGCGSCHGSGYSSSTVYAATHRNGKVNLSARIGFDPRRRTCSNSCHHRERWLGSKGGGDDHMEADFIVGDDGAAGGQGAPGEGAGGCSSAGGSLSLLGILGVALAARRRRRAP